MVVEVGCCPCESVVVPVPGLPGPPGPEGPPGAGSMDTQNVVASESLLAGDLVNVFSDVGLFRVRKADASQINIEAHGFVLTAYTAGQTATVYFEGSNTAVTGMTPGVRYLSEITPGESTATAPSISGQVVQRVGVGVAATVLNVEFASPIYIS